MSTPRNRRPTCSCGPEHTTPSGHCRICARAYRKLKAKQRTERLGLAHQAAEARGVKKIARWDECSAEADRANRIIALIEQHNRAGTPWERAEIDREIAKLSRLDTGAK